MPRLPLRCPSAIKRLGDRYQWQEIDESEYREERATLEARLTELPPPADSNVVAFDRAGERLLPIATVLKETTPEHQGALVRHIVERVTIQGGNVADITLRPEARPFYSEFGNGAPGRARGVCRHTSWTRGWWLTPDGLDLPFQQRVTRGAGLIIAGQKLSPA